MTWSSSFERGLVPVAAFALAGAAEGDAGRGAGDMPGPVLGVPVACDMETDCSIQKYVDRAPGPDRLDYRCGKLTTDGHDGTDLRLRRYPDMARNVAVLAAAPGTVARTRDGMADVAVNDEAAAPIGERLAGNAVVIDHGGGWETQYSHLKRGSLRVRPGDRVAAGAVLGAIGMSGNAEFPHLHFEVRHDRQSVDPFSAAGNSGCGPAALSLWSNAASKVLEYRATQILAAGFATSAAEAPTAYRNISPLPRVDNPSALILWGNASGVKAGDVEKFRILAPNGGVMMDRQSPIMGDRLHWVGFAGSKRPATGWQTGTYVGVYQIVRKGRSLGEQVVRKYISE
jgi:murein DD-endopeptidase MepM/ murein hydrolase activator NlpD